LIAQVYQDDAKYAKLVKSSRAAYEDRLNWDAWGRTVTKLIHEKLERIKSRTESNTTVILRA